MPVGKSTKEIIAADWHVHWDNRYGTFVDIDAKGDVNPNGGWRIKIQPQPSNRDMTNGMHAQNHDYPGLLSTPETDWLFFGNETYQDNQRFSLFRVYTQPYLNIH